MTLFDNPLAQSAVLKTPDQIRIVFTDNSWFDFVEPPNFLFKTFITEVRSAGYILSDAVYVPAHMIKTIFKWNEANKPNMGTMAPGNAPTTETKQ